MFLLISGLIFTGVLEVFDVVPVSSINEIIVFSGAFIVSWLAGFITPGAPAGVGVREMVIIILLGGVANEASLLMAVVISRMITVIGDLLFYSAMYFIPNNREVG
jgi:uncharacterized membrane protein YbhN (UPF0104 family)